MSLLIDTNGRLGKSQSAGGRFARWLYRGHYELCGVAFLAEFQSGGRTKENAHGKMRPDCDLRVCNPVRDREPRWYCRRPTALSQSGVALDEKHDDQIDES